MELDKRFKVLPFCCLSAEKCDKYIGQKGYFSNNIALFKNIDLCIDGTLEAVHGDEAESFEMRDNRKFYRYRYFIPESLVKPKEKQYRPYTFMEFSDKFTVGQPIKFRQKGAVGWERYLVLSGYQHEQHEGRTVTYIYIGPQDYTLDALFNDYEWQEHYTEDFIPFGVEEEK